MVSRRGNIWIVLLGVLLLISLSVSGYFFWQNQQLKQQELEAREPTPGTVPTPENSNEKFDTLSWKTYQGSGINYTIKYPENWQAIPGNNEMGPTYDRFQSFRDPSENVKGFPEGELMITFGKANNPGYSGTLEQWFRKEFSSGSYLTKEPAMVGNYEAIKITQDEPIGRTTYYFLKDAGQVYQIWIVGLSSKENYQLTDQVISTLVIGGNSSDKSFTDPAKKYSFNYPGRFTVISYVPVTFNNTMLEGVTNNCRGPILQDSQDPNILIVFEVVSARSDGAFCWSNGIFSADSKWKPGEQAWKGDYFLMQEAARSKELIAVVGLANKETYSLKGEDALNLILSTFKFTN